MASPEQLRLTLFGRVRLGLTLLKETATEFVDDDATRHGAALAYYTLFSIAPVLVLAISIAGLLYGEATARAEVSARLRELLGSDGAAAVEGLLNRALPPDAGWLSTVIALATLLLGASTVFVQLRGSFNHIWDAPAPKGNGLVTLLRLQGFGALMVLLMGALLLASLALNTVVSLAGDLIGQWLSLSPGLLAVAYQVLSFTLVTLLFAALFKLLPAVTVAWGDVWVGAILTTLLFGIGRSGIAAYIEHAGVTTAYGAAGSLVAFMVWVFWSAQILLFGAEFTQVYGRRAGSRRRERGLLERHKKDQRVTDPSNEEDTLGGPPPAPGRRREPLREDRRHE